MKFAEIELPSNKKFGIFFCFVFAVICAYLFIKGNTLTATVFGFLACLTGALSLVLPTILTPFNRGWMWIGYVLGRIISPVVLGVIFFCLLTPISLFSRALGRDELRLKLTKANTYWRKREPVGPNADSFKNQY